MTGISSEFSKKLSAAVEKMSAFPKSVQRGKCNGVVNEQPPAMAERFGGNLNKIIVQLGDPSNVVAEAQAFAQTSKGIRP